MTDDTNLLGDEGQDHESYTDDQDHESYTVEIPTYLIKRFHFNGNWETIKRGLTLEEAQAHCNDPSTHGGSTDDGTAWFDGYSEED
jgi:hypothetical protein